MAIDIALKADIDLGEGAKSLKQLKQEFKEAQKDLDGLTVGSEKYIATLKKLGGIKDQIGDLNNEINTFNPAGKVKALTDTLGLAASGFQVATASVALFGGESKELEKSLLKVQAAMALSTGLQSLADAGDKFKNLGNVVKDFANNILGAERVTKIATTAQRIWNAVLAANPILLITGLIAALSAGVYALVKAMDSSGDASAKLQAKYDALKKSIEDNNAVIDSQVKLLEAVGGKENEIFEIRRKQMEQQIELSKIALQKALLEQGQLRGTTVLEEALLGVQGAKAKALQEQIEAQKNVAKAYKDVQIAVNSLAEVDAREDKRKAEAQKKQDDSDKQRLQKELQDRKTTLDALKQLEAQKAKEVEDITAKSATQKLELEYQRAYENFQKIYTAAKKAGADEIELERLKNQTISAIEEEYRIKRKQIADEDAEAKRVAAEEEAAANVELYNKKIEDDKARSEADKEAKKKAAEEARQIDQETFAQTISTAQATNDSFIALSDLYFLAKSRNLQKGTAAELAAAKKQFQINKALAITSTVISTIQGIVNALSAQSIVPEPYGTILKVATAVGIGIAGTVNTAKIAATQFNPGGGGGSVPSLSAPQVNAPSINAPQNSTTNLNPDGTIQNNAPPPQPTPIVKAIVVETDITKSQKRISSIEEQATIK